MYSKSFNQNIEISNKFHLIICRDLNATVLPKRFNREKKKEIWPSPMTKPPIPTENSKTKGQHTNATKNFDYTTNTYIDELQHVAECVLSRYALCLWRALNLQWSITKWFRYCINYHFTLQCMIQQSIWFDQTTLCNLYWYWYEYSVPIHIFNQTCSMAQVRTSVQ